MTEKEFKKFKQADNCKKIIELCDCYIKELSKCYISEIHCIPLSSDEQSNEIEMQFSKDYDDKIGRNAIKISIKDKMLEKLIDIYKEEKLKAEQEFKKL